VILYTSDHSQILTEAWGDSLMQDIIWGQVAVPLWMLGTARPALDSGYNASHANIMATLLDLMEVPMAARPFAYPRSLLTAAASDRDVRQVFTGSFFGVGAFAIRDFDELPGGPKNGPR
jgi:arylsulfatase A-like enzyme